MKRQEIALTDAMRAWIKEQSKLRGCSEAQVVRDCVRVAMDAARRPE